MWGISSNYPTIRNHGDARRTYENTKPLCGKPNLRPLDRRSMYAKSQILEDGDDYIIRLYQTNIIRYKPDGRVFLNHGGYVTVTTADAISAMSPYTAWCRKGYLVVTSASRRGYSDGHHKFVVSRDGLEFDAQGVPKDPPVAVIRKTRVRRDVAKQVRAHFKQVPKMIEAYAKVFEGGDASRPTSRPLVKSDMDSPLSEELASEIAMGYMDRSYDYRAQLWTYSGRGHVATFWKNAYNVFGCVETYEIQLPYGEVP